MHDLDEFRDLFQAAHDGTSTMEQDNRGCEIIEMWMKREKRRRLAA